MKTQPQNLNLNLDQLYKKESEIMAALRQLLLDDPIYTLAALTRIGHQANITLQRGF